MHASVPPADTSLALTESSERQAISVSTQCGLALPQCVVQAAGVLVMQSFGRLFITPACSDTAHKAHNAPPYDVHYRLPRHRVERHKLPSVSETDSARVLLALC